MTSGDAHALIDDARARLIAAGAPRERLGDWAQVHKLLAFARKPRIVPVGEVWHLGVLLIGRAGVFATGEVLRAREEAVRGYTAETQRERASRAYAAFRGGFAEGETLHVGWEPIDLDEVDAGRASGPLSMVDGVPHVRWSPAGTRPLADYLHDLLSLR